MISEDILEEMLVDGGEEGVQLALFELGGRVSPVQVCTILPGLEKGRQKSSLGGGGSGVIDLQTKERVNISQDICVLPSPCSPAKLLPP